MANVDLKLPSTIIIYNTFKCLFRNEKEIIYWSRNASRNCMILGSLLETCRSAIGQFVPLFLVPLIFPEVFAKVNSAQLPSHF